MTKNALMSTSSVVVAIMASLTFAGGALAQAGTTEPTSSPAEQAGEGETDESAIVVTGSRIARDGFDQPTPTTVIDDVELRQGARPNLAQILNDQPQFRQTTTPQVSNGNTSTGTAPVDLRGLGSARTLVLLNGRRFVGENNLNFIPSSLVERLEVVTGGASAAWGSNAVAGVVNIIIKDELDGVSVGVQNGISSRGDGMRYGFDASFGTKFADGNGSFLIGAEYRDDKGIPNRNSRSNLGSAAIARVNPLSTTDATSALTRDVNNGNSSAGGLITTGVLAGQTFNPDGTLRPFRGGQRLGAAAFPAQMVGGEDGLGLFDDVAASTPFDRLAAYARVSYDLDNAKVYADFTYGRATTDARFVPDFLVPAQTIQASNPFLSATIRNQLAAVGQTSFTLGRNFNDILFLRFDTERVNKEGSIGIEGTIGTNYRYRAHYSHGEIESDQKLRNARLAGNFTRALNAVSSGGQIVCAVNADVITTNDDPACRPLNPFGQFNASSESLAYVTGTQQSFTTNKLDSAGVEVQGEPFSLWAGPVTVAVGAEARWEEQKSMRSPATVAGGFGIPLFTSDLSGGFNVKEGFAEIALPLANFEDTFKFDLSGAVRYSDFSNSGGIFTWKVGGTARLFNDLLLRATRSRDIRSPGIGNLFAVRNINVGPLVDQDSAGRLAANPAYNANPATVTTFSGGNPNLVEEVAQTLIIGGSFQPSFIPGFSASVDYYDIKIGGAIATLNGSALTLACRNGSTAACDRITRDATGTVVQALSNSQNIASFETRGLDFEVAYVLPLSDLSASTPGTLRLRALATYIDAFVFDTGITRVDSAGDVGDATANSIPKWRGTLSATYQADDFAIDLRARYVDGGLYNRALAIKTSPAGVTTGLINNQIGSRTYIDAGVQFKVQDRFTLSANVNNIFDVAPPITPGGNPHYDIVGTYFTVGAKVNF